MNTLEKIIRYSIKGIIVLIPLFFLPISTSRIGMDFLSKEYMLWFVLPLLLFLWFALVVKKEGGFIYRTRFDYLILVYLFLLSVSVLFSTDIFSSVFGAFGGLTQPLLSVFSLVLFFYLYINVFTKKENIHNTIKLMLASYVVIVLVAAMLVLGYFGNNTFLTKYFTLAVGNLEDLSVYLAVINIFVFSMIVNKSLLQLLCGKKKVQWLFRIIFSISLFILTLINYYLSWVVLFLGVVSVVSINRLKKSLDKKEGMSWHIKAKNNVWTIVVLTLATIFLINHFSYGGIYGEKTRFYQKFQLDISNSLQITKDSLKKYPLFGSGPETYSYLFSRYRDPSFNQSEHWALRFNQGSSFVLELFATTGVLPSLSYLAMIFYFLFYSVRKIMQLRIEADEDGYNNEILIGLWSMLLVLIVLEFMFPVSIVLRFLFWLVAGLILSYLNNIFKGSLFRKFIFSSESKIRKFITPFLFLVISCWAILAGYELRFWLADITYAKVISSNSVENRERDLIGVIGLNKHRGSFYATLAKHYLNLARSEMQKSEGEKSLEVINDNINKSISTVQSGIEIAPNSVVLYETLGMIYRAMSAVAGNTGPLAKEAFAKASELEPSNPVLKTELGKSMFASHELDKAIITLKEAIELKEDYYDAHFNLARVLIQKSENVQAVELLDKIEGEINNPEFYYERGRANFNIKNYDKAISDFKIVINNVPLHSNALYSLGLALSEKGENDEALVYLNKALIINPNSEALKSLIASIEAGEN